MRAGERARHTPRGASGEVPPVDFEQEWCRARQRASVPEPRPRACERCRGSAPARSRVPDSAVPRLSQRVRCSAPRRARLASHLRVSRSRNRPFEEWRVRASRRVARYPAPPPRPGARRRNNNSSDPSTARPTGSRRRDWRRGNYRFRSFAPEGPTSPREQRRAASSPAQSQRVRTGLAFVLAVECRGTYCRCYRNHP